MTYWCPIAEDWTDPPIPKRTTNTRRGWNGRKLITHFLHEGKALCGKKSPAWFHRPEDKPTCEECLSRMTQLRWWER